MPHSIAFIVLFITTICTTSLVGCDSNSNSEPVELSFEAMINGIAADCTTTYNNLGINANDARLADARLFVSEIALRNQQNEWIPLNLENDGTWQSNNIALLDFENGQSACADSGTAEMNTSITGSIPSGQYNGLQFRIGIPFEWNHIDNATSSPPFNVPGMFWAWQGGYKFLRTDWLVDGGTVPRWNMHLGSTECVSAAPTQAPTNICGRPNAAIITLDNFLHDTNVISIDLAALIATSDLSTNIDNTPSGCQSNPAETSDCEAAFLALGLDFSAGICQNDCQGQSIFSVQ